MDTGSSSGTSAHRSNGEKPPIPPPDPLCRLNGETAAFPLGIRGNGFPRLSESGLPATDTR